MRTGKNIYKTQPTVTIGILGTGAAVGTTHLAFMLAVFLSSVMGRTTALVEHNDSQCFRQAEIILRNLKTRNISKIKKISIFKHTDDQELSKIIESGFEYVVVDFGKNFLEAKSLFYMCTSKMIVGSLSLWRIQEYVEFLVRREKEGARAHWAYLATSPIQEGQQYLKHKLGIRVQVIPFEPDPFSLGKDSLDFLQSLCDRLF